MNVMRLDLRGDRRLATFSADPIQYPSRFPSHRYGQDIAPNLWTPD